MKKAVQRQPAGSGALVRSAGSSPRYGGLPARGLLLVLLLALSNACGFKLRGEVALPPAMDAVLLQGIDRYSEQGQDIVVSLVAVGSHVTEARADATSVLRITSYNMERRVLSVDAAGKANEYELIYRLSFQLENKAGEVLLPQQTILQIRDYIFDPNNVLGKSEEEAQLRRQMQKEAASRMLRRIEAGLRASPRATRTGGAGPG